MFESLEDCFEKKQPKIGIYSDAGVGKTILSCTVDGRIGLIDIENGFESLKKLPLEMRKKISRIKINRDSPSEAVSFAIAQHEQFDWLVIDSISELAELLLIEYKNKMPSPDPRKYYPAVEDDVLELIRELRDLPCGVIFIFKEEVIKKEIKSNNTVESIDYYRMFLPGQKLPLKIPHLLSEVWRLTKSLSGRRELLTENDARSKAKSRGDLPARIDVTDTGLQPVIDMLMSTGTEE